MVIIDMTKVNIKVQNLKHSSEILIIY